jgi:hypothetical protein
MNNKRRGVMDLMRVTGEGVELSKIACSSVSNEMFYCESTLDNGTNFSGFNYFCPMDKRMSSIDDVMLVMPVVVSSVLRRMMKKICGRRGLLTKVCGERREEHRC